MKEFTNESLRTVVAVDTNLFLLLARKNINQPEKKGKGKGKNGFFHTIKSLKLKCVNGSLKIVILPQVWEEIKERLTQKEKDFLENYCVFLEPKNAEEFATQATKLAFTYLKKGVMEQEGESGQITSDAIIMAQSSIAGINLLTCNYKHFLYYENHLNEKKKKTYRLRADDIEAINSQFGLYFAMHNESVFVPRPCSPAEYFELYRGGNFYELEEYENIELKERNF